MTALFWERESTDGDAATAVGAADPSPVVEFDDVSHTYVGPPPVRALQRTCFTVEPGDYVAVTGPSGSGKSTVMNLIGLLDRPTEGRIILDGVDTGSLSENRRTALRGRRIGFVFQSFHLLAHRSALDNVSLAGLYQKVPRRQRHAAASTVLADVGLQHRANAQPGQLSGGERQRVAIARALALQPSLLLCDEPTGNLDTATTENILDLLDDLNSRGMTIVVITHDPQVSRRAARQLHIRDGILGETP